MVFHQFHHNEYIYSSKTSQLETQAERHLHHGLRVAIKTQKMAQSATRTGRKKKLLFLPALLASELLPAVTLALTLFILNLLKLDIRSKARFTKAFSEADAGVVGIDSTKAHRAEEN